MKHGMKVVDGKRIYMLEFTDEHLAVLQEGLMHVPYGRAAPVVNHINEQLKPEPPAAPAGEPERSVASN